MSYRVFVRNWWKIENGVQVPHVNAPATTVQYVSSEEEARRICREGNADRPQTWVRLGRKYEYEG